MRRGIRAWLRDWWAGLSPTPGAGDRLSGETWNEQIERRLAACEVNLQNIWEHLNARDAGHG